MPNAAPSRRKPALGPSPTTMPGRGLIRSRPHRLSVGLAPLLCCWLGVTCAKAQDLESIPAGEAQAINTIVALALGELQKRYPPGAPLARRDAHAKAHGCVKATLRVDDNLAVGLRVGTWAAPGKAFRTWVRFSNGAFEPGADTDMDGRGMALKIMEPPSPDATPAPTATSHDILMINHPVFFSPDAIDYADFAKAGALTGNSDGLKRYFIPSYNPLRWRVRQGLIAYRIASQKITSPLAIQYFSMVPSLFGSGRAVKYSARPCPSTSSNQPGSTDASGLHFLQKAMQEQLNRGPACFELMMQERQPGMPIEDATVEWRQSDSPFRRVGVITIPQQKFQTPARTEFCENTAFSPWNAPPMHLPLGSINRVRKVLYERISGERHNRHGNLPPNPREAWERL
jgi:Catalase